jgi:hypothetical protein
VPSQLKSIVLRAPGKAGLNFEGESMQASPSYADVANNIAYDFAGRLANRKGWEASTTLASHLGKKGSSLINPFAVVTTAGLRSRVKVNDNSHGAVSGDFVTFTGAEDFQGITAAQINKRFSLTKLTDDYYYVYIDGISGTAGSGGGSSVAVYYEPQINTLFTYNYNDAALLIASAIVRGAGKIYDHPVGSSTAVFTDRSGALAGASQTLSVTDAKWQFNNYKSVSTVVCVGTNTNNAKVPIVKTGAGNWAGLLPMPETLAYSSSLDSQGASTTHVVAAAQPGSDGLSTIADGVFTTGRIITVTVAGTSEGTRHIRITGKDAAGAALVAFKALGGSATTHTLTSVDKVGTTSQTTDLYFKTITEVRIETASGDTTVINTVGNISVGVAVGHVEVAGLSNLSVDAAPTDVPTGGISHSAFGRLWLQKSATGVNQNVIVYSGANNHQQWYVGASAANAGELDLAANFSAWKNGYDELVAISSFDKFLVAFMRNSIIVYESPDNVANIKINMALQGVGCLSKDSIQSVGNDLYFLSATGVRSLRQVLQSGDKVELSDISVLVRRALMDDVASAETVLPSVRSNYDPEEGQYWLKSAAGTIWVFDLASLNPGIPTRITKYVDTGWFSFCYHEGESYLGYQGRIGKYNNYLDDGAAYECEWLSNPFDLDTSNLKVLKKIGATIEGQSTDEVTITTQFSEGGYSGLTMFLSEGLSDSRSAPGSKAEWSSRYSSGYLLCGVDLTDIQYPYVLPHNAPFKITVNGSTSGTINLPAATYSNKDEIATTLATAINNDATLGDNNVTVTVDSPATVDFQPWNIGNRLRITSTSTATTSAVTIPSGDTTTTAVTGTGGHKVIPYVSRIFDSLVGLTNTLYDTDNGGVTVSTIGAELASGASTCALSADDEDAKLRMTGDMAVALDDNSGTIRIGTETIRYNGISTASPPVLNGLTRGINAAAINTVACVSASSTITVTTAADTNYKIGDLITIAGAVDLGHGIVAAVLNKTHTITAMATVRIFTFTAINTSGALVTASGGASTNVGGSATINAAATHAAGSDYHLVNEAGDFTNGHTVIARDAGIARVGTEGQDFSNTARQDTDTNEGEWGGGSVNVVNLSQSSSGAGRSLRVGVRFNSNGYKVALDQVSLFLKLGREGR